MCDSPKNLHLGKYPEKLYSMHEANEFPVKGGSKNKDELHGEKKKKCPGGKTTKQHADKPPPPPTSWDKTIFAFSRNEIDERSHNDAMVLVVL